MKGSCAISLVPASPFRAIRRQLACHAGLRGSRGRRGPAELSSYGGWEAEWNIPEKSKLGISKFAAKSAGDDYDGRASITLRNIVSRNFRW